MRCWTGLTGISGRLLSLLLTARQLSSVLSAPSACGVVIGLQHYVMPIHTTDLCQSSLLHCLEHRGADLRWRVANECSCSFQCRDLVLCFAFSSRDDCTCVTHSSTWRCCSSSDESYYRFRVRASLVVLFQVSSCFLLHGTTDLSDENDTLSLVILHESLYDINMLRAGEGVSTDTDAKSLTKSNFRGLVNSFVCQCSRTRNDTNLSWAEDSSWHDSNLATASVFGLHDTGAVGSDHSGL